MSAGDRNDTREGLPASMHSAKVSLRGRLGRLALRASERLNSRHYAPLEYPQTYDSRPRYGYGRPPHPELAALVSRHDDDYRARLETIVGYTSELATIPLDQAGNIEPFWRNGWLPGLDGASIYVFLRELRPARYVEIGSGNSTKFAARARRQGELPTRITSIDPFPRAEIDELCDRVIREPLETMDLAVFSELREGDVVFLDSSHAAFMNSDVTVFFLDILPRLPAGVRVGIHDIYIPDDYPREAGEVGYAEQYLLACYMLGGALVTPVLPGIYVSRHPELSQALAPLWDDPRLQDVERHGCAFWLETGR
jgi:Methyltransferase domain